MTERAVNRLFLNDRPCAAPELSDESAHFSVCRACGQAVDCRRLGDVLHHDSEGHKPIPVD